MHHKIAFVDLDGTINSSNRSRAHLVPKDGRKEENWRDWHAAHINEQPNNAVIEVVKALQESGWIIIFLTMRSSGSSASTIKQLDKWIGGGYALITKSDGDSRQPGIYKADEVKSKTCIAHHSGERLDVLVIDDSKEVCDAVRGLVVPSNIRINVMQITPFTGE